MKDSSFLKSFDLICDWIKCFPTDEVHSSAGKTFIA